MIITINKSTVGCREFYINYIPIILYKSLVNYYVDHEIEYSKLSREFEDKYKCKVLDVIRKFIECIKIDENKECYMYKVDPNMRDRLGNKYDTMFNFINDGSISVRGMDFYRYLNESIHENLKSLYDMYIYSRLA